jgi:hypothetical protein
MSISEVSTITSKKYIFGFMDETGVLHSPITDRVFAFGLLKLHHPRLVHQSIIDLKNRRHYHNELKFTHITNTSAPLYCDLIDIFFNVQNCFFSCMVIDKTLIDLNKFFNGDHVHAYNSYAAKLIAESLDPGEYITIIADDISSPKSDNFEKNMKIKIKRKIKRNALFGIVRVESHAVSELQMVDVLLGLVGYAYKLKYNSVSPSPDKLKVLKYLQSKLEVTNLAVDGLKKRKKGGCIFRVNEFIP